MTLADQAHSYKLKWIHDFARNSIVKKVNHPVEKKVTEVLCHDLVIRCAIFSCCRPPRRLSIYVAYIKKKQVGQLLF